MNWIANLKLRQKFAVMTGLAAAAMAVPAWMAIQSSWSTWRTLQQEEAGLEPAQALLKLVRVTQEHRGLTNTVMSGRDQLEPKRREKQAAVTELMQSADQALHHHGFQTLGDDIDEIIKTWEALGKDVTAHHVTAPESVKRHTALVQQEMDLIDRLLDTSGMSLDADSRSYFAIMAGYRDLPRMVERYGLARARGAGILASGERDASAVAGLMSQMEAAQLHARDVQRGLRKIGIDTDSELKGLDELWKTAQASQQAIRELTQAVATGQSTLEPDAFFAQMTQHIGAQFALSDAVLKMLGDEVRARQHHELLRVLLVVGGILALSGLALGVSLITRRTVLDATQEASRVAQALAEGDLTVRAHSRSRDELGDMVRDLGVAMDRLRDLLGRIRQASDTVSTAAGEIAQGNNDLSQRTETQASSLQQTAASMEQISSMVRMNSNTAQQANQLAHDASQGASQSGDTFREVIGKMGDIRDASRRIAEINAVIDGIAFQTNILALNAAVEAARAGEQGRGFAVVAAEVRSLAQRSANAAKEIKTLISQSTDIVEAGYQLAESTGQNIHALVEHVMSVSQLMSNLASGNEQQHLGIEQVNQAVTLLDQGTQQNAALVEQSSAAAMSLNQQASSLREMVGAFKLS